jgi:alanine dehydrogenase
MHAEPGEKRDFLPEFVAGLVKNGADVVLERGYGTQMGFSEEDYLKLEPSAVFTTHDQVYQQDIILLIRYPSDDEIKMMSPGACLMTMLHYPTRPDRVEFLCGLDIEAISLDSIKDDSGRRVVENLHAVAWNGLEVSFETLRLTYPAPGFDDPTRGPIHVTQLGSGAVGVHVMQAAIRYGNIAKWQAHAARGIPGVQVSVVDFDSTPFENVMRPILAHTDILVDATQRIDPTRPVIPNDWVGYLPDHAVLVDLSVDPYDCRTYPNFTKGIEGIPQGNLDQYVFAPDDRAYDSIPECISTIHRRYAVSCYSWPGIHPKECMQVYGYQLQPLMRKLIEKGGVDNINPSGSFFERAIGRAKLSTWLKKLEERNQT